MKFHRRWVRVARAVAVAMAILVFGMVAFVNIQQRVLRWRAERLLADIRAIQMGKSTAPDIEQFMKRWRPWSYSKRDCSLESCFYGVELQDELWTLASAYDHYSGFWKLLSVPYWLVGGRSAMITADLRIENRRVFQSSFSLFVVGPPKIHRDPSELGAVVGNATQYVNGFDQYNFQSQRLLHPEYWIGKPGECEGCIKLDTGFTPLVDQKTMLALTGFDLSCITRWRTCTREADILPEAWVQYQAELKADEDASKAFNNCTVPVEFWGREYQGIFVGDVIRFDHKITLTLGGGAYHSATVRMVRALKGHTSMQLNRAYPTDIFDWGEQSNGWHSADIAEGRRYIFMGAFEQSPINRADLDLDQCVVPYTEVNLAGVQRGIDESEARKAALAKKLKH